MKITDSLKNRCAIFLFYDRDGVVDDYIVYMLRDLKKSIAHMLVVCNGAPSEEGLEILKQEADEVLIRKNSGFDVGGYREGLFYIGFSRLAEYDEVILFNYTFFGSIYPFFEMFEKMSGRDVDFWGITKHHLVDYDPYEGKNRYGYLPEHIQSHFLVLRKSLFLSDDYKEFIISMENPKTYVDSICEYESIFTKHFEDLGYKWDVYVNTDRLEKYAYNPGMFYVRELLEKDRCPIMKRRSFFTNYRDFLINTAGEPSVEAYAYIREHTDYDVNMIWDNILRLENMTDISKAMHLNYCLPDEAVFKEQELTDVFIAVWVKNADNLEFYRQHIEDMPKSCPTALFGAGEEIEKVKELLKGCQTLFVFEKELASYQEFIKEVQEKSPKMTMFYACEVVDTVETIKPYSNVISNVYKNWTCMLASEEFVSNVKTTFAENPRLGLLIPPVPDFGEYYAIYMQGWNGKYDAVSQYLSRLSIQGNIKPEIVQMLPVGGSLWMTRAMLYGDSMKAALGCPVPDEVFWYALVCIVQSQGAYTGVLYSSRYAAIEVTNSDHMMRELNKAVFKKYGPDFHDVVLDRVKKNLTENGTATLKGRMKQGLKKKLPKAWYQKGKKIYFKLRGRQ